MGIEPLLFGIEFLDLEWWLGHFGEALFWISLAVLFVECGLLFPFLPGDTLLFSIGLFIATEQIDLFPGGVATELTIAMVLMVLAAFAAMKWQSDPLIVVVGIIGMALVFLFWFFLGHMIFALFLGLSPMTNVHSALDVYLTSEGLGMLATGTLVGAMFAALVYALAVLALPMLLDREVDFVTAMIASFQYVAAHPGPMLGWAALIAMATFAGLAAGFLGLILVLPMLGHASWHLY
ncbi:DUF2189 domain-containing protein, partial [uncultured Nocardioides sp.]|uniref:DUF2189 domain-containing protein n=1 Tax=uncultured Nocardioides sp. TaxID=198441 RepID=UPI00260B6FDC